MQIVQRKKITAFFIILGMSLCLSEVQAETPDNPGTIRLTLPQRIYAVAGMEMNVYFDNICLVPNINNYVIDVNCPKGSHQVERWTFVPEDADVGEYPLVIEVRDAANTIIASASTRLEVVPRKAGADRKLRVLCVGDSLTASHAYPLHLLALGAMEDNPDITLLGRLRTENNPDLRSEGYGGWTAKRFVTAIKDGWQPSADATMDDIRNNGSPFLYRDASGQPGLDFARYCQDFNQGKAPDFVTIFLGCNDNFGAKDENIETSIDTMFEFYDQLLEMVHKFDKNIKIGALLLVPPAATQDAFGQNYKCGQTRWQYKRNQHRVVERMLERYKDRESENIFLIPSQVNLDCVHNYPTRRSTWNAYTQQEGLRLNNGVHPATDGYKQIGDSIFFWIKSQMAK